MTRDDMVVVNVTLARDLVKQLDHATADTRLRRNAVMDRLLRFGLLNKDKILSPE